MKYTCIFLLIFISHFELKAQAQNDYFWVLGYPPNTPEKFYGGVILNFNKNIVTPEYFNTISRGHEPSILSSNTGRLLAYTDGCRIFNTLHEIMVGGDSISYGQIWENYCDYLYPTDQAKLLLPWPGDTSKAILFHIKILDDRSTHHLLYSVIEFNNLHPLGIVVEKNKFLLDPGTSALFTAVRHGNGRDWWLIFPEDETNRFFSILLDHTGVKIVDTLTIGLPWGPREWASQAIFSPDGTKYIRMNPWKGLDIFDFDRCTGKLSNIRESGPLSDPVIFGAGAGISIDSRYLYVSNTLYLYQYDLLAQNIFGSKILIDTYDGYLNPFPTNFYQMMLAPDGKIYMFSSNGVKSLHVINRPEMQGKSCNFVQHAMEMPAYCSIGSVNLPHYRLGPFDESTCDTLGIDNLPIADFRFEIDSVYPLKVYFRNLSYFEPSGFDWNFGNTTISLLKDPGPVYFDEPGAYNVCLQAKNNYGQNVFCRNIILGDSLTKVDPITNNSTITIYPNPFENEIYVRKAIGEPLKIVILNSLGIAIYSKHLTDLENKIDLGQIPNGIYYYLVLKENQTIQSGKLIRI